MNQPAICWMAKHIVHSFIRPVTENCSSLLRYSVLSSISFRVAFVAASREVGLFTSGAGVFVGSTAEQGEEC